MQLLITQFSLVTCYVLPLMPKYLQRHPILEHLQPMYFSHCER